MKSIKQLSLIVLSITIILCSCSIEKRLYMSGYHINLNKSKHNPYNRELVSNTNSNHSELNQIETVEESENEVNIVNNSSTISEEKITASVDNQQIIFSQKEKINLVSSDKVQTLEEEEKVVVDKNNSSLKTELKKETKIDSENGDHVKTQPLALTSFILSMVGLILNMLAWFFGPLSIIFGIIALSKIKRDKTKWKGKGFAIAGIVIGIVSIPVFLILLVLKMLNMIN